MSMAIIPKVKSGLMADEGTFKYFFNINLFQRFRVLRVQTTWGLFLKISLDSYKRIWRKKQRKTPEE
jgi:hypothetical protein